MTWITESSTASDQVLSPAHTRADRNLYAGFWFYFIFYHKGKVNKEANAIQYRNLDKRYIDVSCTCFLFLQLSLSSKTLFKKKKKTLFKKKKKKGKPQTPREDTHNTGIQQRIRNSKRTPRTPQKKSPSSGFWKEDRETAQPWMEIVPWAPQHPTQARKKHKVTPVLPITRTDT